MAPLAVVSVSALASDPPAVLLLNICSLRQEFTVTQCDMTWWMAGRLRQPGPAGSADLPLGRPESLPASRPGPTPAAGMRPCLLTVGPAASPPGLPVLPAGFAGVAGPPPRPTLGADGSTAGAPGRAGQGRARSAGIGCAARGLGRKEMGVARPWRVLAQLVDALAFMPTKL